MNPTSLLELYEGHPERFCQTANARDAQGNPIDSRDEAAVSWCLNGAVERFFPKTTWDVWNKLRAAMKTMFPENCAVIVYADTHSHAEVVELCRKAGV